MLSTRFPEISATREKLTELNIGWGKIHESDEHEVVSTAAVYKALGLPSAGVVSHYTPIQYVGIIFDVEEK